MHPIIPGLIANTILGVGNNRMIARRTPAKASSGQHKEALGQSAIELANKLSPGNQRNSVIQLNENIPPFADSFIDDVNKQMSYASYSRGNDPTTGEFKGGVININPNTSAEYLAHELGHHVDDQTKIGNLIANLRMNPKLAIALGASGGMLGVPFVQAALQEGDDDIATGIAASALLNSPTLINEARASNNALRIMKDAGMPATPAQKARLAGGYLSYMAIPIMAGLGGNVLGNFADDYTAVYDL